MKIKGSITVLLSLTLIIVLALDFSLLEIVHIRACAMRAKAISTQSIENIFSEYNRPIWDKYRVLMIDSRYGEPSKNSNLQNVNNRMLQFIEKDTIPVSKGIDLTNVQGVNAEVNRYQLITDQNGQAFIKQGAKTAKYVVGEDVVQVLIEQVEKTSQENVDVAELLVEGEKALQKAEEIKGDLEQESQSKKSDNQVESTKEVPQNVENPIKVIKEWKTNGILGLIVENPDELSHKTMDISQTVSNRILQKGNVEDTSKVTVADKVLYEQYLLRKFTNYLNPGSDEGMAYEMEYILCGEESDRENLSEMTEKLLALREIENYVAIVSDITKMQKSLALATSYVGATGNPAIIKAVQLGIVGAWAFVESILDVRLVLTGGKVALLKNVQQWTSDLYQLGSYLPTSMKAKECESGIGYQGYLTALLFAIPEKHLGLRPLDLMEYFLNQQEDYVNVCMDYMICKAEIACDYEANPLFLSMAGIGSSRINRYQFHQKVQMSY